MGLRNRIFQSDHPYHIYNRANNQEYLFNLKETYSVFLKCLENVVRGSDFRPHHFILLNNHYHLIASTPKSNLDECMHKFQRSVTAMINAKYNRINHLFGSRYGATVIKSEGYLSNTIRYLYQNPVRAGIVRNPLEYPFSSLSVYLVDFEKQTIFFKDPYLDSIKHEKLTQHIVELCEISLEEKKLKDLRKIFRKSTCG